jgi:sugar lactone lactonase YvrE
MLALPNTVIQRLGHDLHRPECVVGAPNGDVYVPDWRGGVGVIRADGTQQVWLAKNSAFDLKPNGIVPTPRGAFRIANLGDDGGVWDLSLDGGLEPVLTEIGGRPLPPANFVFIDEAERTWVTVSTRHLPRQQAWRPDVKDGFVVRIDRAGAKVVLDGLHYTNEARVDPAGEHLYVVETFGKRLLRVPLRADGELGEPQVAAEFGHGFFPDGFSFDVEGGIWVTSLISNQVVRVDRDGAQQVVVQEANTSFVDAAQQAFDGYRMVREHLGEIPDVRFQHLTSVAFGGPDHRTGGLGCLHGSNIYKFRSEVAGAPSPHWSYKLP